MDIPPNNFRRKIMKQIATKETHYYRTFKEFLTESSAKFQDRPAVTSYMRNGTPQVKSYKDLKNDAFLFGRALCACGLQGKHIALAGQNSYPWLVAYFGTVSAGCTAVCIDVEHSDETVEEMILRADADCIVTSADMEQLCRNIQENHSRIQKLVVIGVNEEAAQSFQAFCRLGDDSEAVRLFDGIEIETGQTASIVFTSGTTSTAKPVMLSHRAILSNAADSLTLLDSEERVYNSLPLYHTYGFTCGIMCPLIRGLNVCINCDLKRMMMEMTSFKPNMIVAVPLIIEVLYKIFWGLIEKTGKKSKIQKLMKVENAVHKPHTLIASDIEAAIQGSCLEGLNVILSGGAYLSLEIAQELLHFGVMVLQGYGITECSPSISCNRNEDFSLDSVGVVLPGNEVKIENDEILVRGYALMNGYYKAPELTEQSFQDGWFKTGDLGYMDKKGHLHITGRKKNLIVMKNGKKVAAEEMEEMLRKIPLVKEVLVYGAVSGVSTDDVKIAAAIYPDPQLTENMSSYDILEQLQSFVDQINSKLPTYKQIQMINIRDTDFDKTSAHKIKRQMV